MAPDEALKILWQLKDPVSMLRRVWEVYEDRAGLSCSFGGPGGMVLAHMAYHAKIRIPVLFVDTDYLFPETLALKERLENEWGLDVRTASSGLGPEEFAFGTAEPLWVTDPDTCCRLRKVEPMARLLDDVDCWVTALRRDQSTTRSVLDKWELHERHDGKTILKANPLADWTRREVWSYIVEHDVPYNPLLDQGYPSIGCIHCTAKSTGGNERSGRWPGREKSECGLHTFTQRRG